MVAGENTYGKNNALPYKRALGLVVVKMLYSNQHHHGISGPATFLEPQCAPASTRLCTTSAYAIGLPSNTSCSSAQAQAQHNIDTLYEDDVKYAFPVSLSEARRTSSISNWSQNASLFYLRPKRSALPVLRGQIPFGAGTAESIAKFVIPHPPHWQPIQPH